jgi:hypothetical protein
LQTSLPLIIPSVSSAPFTFLLCLFCAFFHPSPASQSPSLSHLSSQVFSACPLLPPCGPKVERPLGPHPSRGRWASGRQLEFWWIQVWLALCTHRVGGVGLVPTLLLAQRPGFILILFLETGTESWLWAWLCVNRSH